VQAAQELAAKSKHQQIEPEHLVRALIEQQEGVVTPVLKKLGADPAAVSADIDQALERIPKVEGLVQTYLSARLNKLFEKAEQEAGRLKDEYISAEHLLIAAADGDGAARDVLTRHGITKDRIFTVLVDIRGSQRVTDQNPEDKYQALTRYGRDLTDLAKAGQARPGDRQGRRGAARGAGAFAQDQEQSGAHRRTGRRQDRHRRGAGAARGERRCARGPQEQRVIALDMGA